MTSPDPSVPEPPDNPPGDAEASPTTTTPEDDAGFDPTTPSPSLDAPPSRGALREGIHALRASAIVIVLLLILGGVVYPLGVTLLAQGVTPATANGSLIYDPNGNAVASALIGQNISNLSLFWLRPTLIDYQPFNGSGNELPYGPADPLLVNETLGFIQKYGLQNGSAPIDIVSVSASGLDPDITVGAAWVQIPRIAFHTNLSQAILNDFVNAHAQLPFLGIFGPAEVNVIQLDLLLIHALASHTPLNGA